MQRRHAGAASGGQAQRLQQPGVIVPAVLAPLSYRVQAPRAAQGGRYRELQQADQRQRRVFGAPAIWPSWIGHLLQRRRQRAKRTGRPRRYGFPEQILHRPPLRSPSSHSERGSTLLLFAPGEKALATDPVASRVAI